MTELVRASLSIINSIVGHP